MSLPNNKLGLNIRTEKQIYNECKITVRRILRCSVNEEARKLYEIITIKNVDSDSIVNKAVSKDLPNHKVKEKCKSIFTKEKAESIWNDFMGLKEQCVIIKYIVDVCLTRHFIMANVSKAITCEYSQFLSSMFSHEPS